MFGALQWKERERRVRRPSTAAATAAACSLCTTPPPAARTQPYHLKAFFSNKNVVAQIVRMADGHIVAAASTLEQATREQLKAAGVSGSCSQAATQCVGWAGCGAKPMHVGTLRAAGARCCPRRMRRCTCRWLIPAPSCCPRGPVLPQDRRDAGAARAGGRAGRRALAAAARRALPRQAQGAGGCHECGGPAPRLMLVLLRATVLLPVSGARWGAWVLRGALAAAARRLLPAHAC